MEMIIRVNQMVRLRGCLLLLMLSAAMLSGCSMVQERSPEQWLSLSYTGLAAMDQYAFTGSMRILLSGGVEFKPETFEGKVTDHEKLTLQSNSKEALYWNPMQLLESLNNANEQVTISGEGIDDATNTETITLQIVEDRKVSKQRWEQRLQQQLDTLAQQAPLGNSILTKEWQQELERSRKELHEMLRTMKVNAVYELVIDKKRLIPLKLDNKTEFNYEKQNKPLTESRHTMIRFNSFDGASSVAGQ